MASLFASTVWQIGNFSLEISLIEWNCKGNVMYMLITVDGDIFKPFKLQSMGYFVDAGLGGRGHCPFRAV